jgi:hypothetical protein
MTERQDFAIGACPEPESAERHRPLRELGTFSCKFWGNVQSFRNPDLIDECNNISLRSGVALHIPALHHLGGIMTFSLEQALAEYFDNTGGQGVWWGGTGQGGAITGNVTGGGGSGSSYGSYQVGADGRVYVRNTDGQFVPVSRDTSGGTGNGNGLPSGYTGPLRSWADQPGYVYHMLDVKSQAQYSAVAANYFGNGFTTIETDRGPIVFLNVYRFLQSDGTYTYGFCDGMFVYDSGGQAVAGIFP